MLPHVPVGETGAAVVAATALVALLVTALSHPRGRVEAAVAVVASLAVLGVGALTRDDLDDVVEHLSPVVVFLVAILVVAEVCARAGVFVAAGALVARWSRGRPVRLLTGIFVLAAVVTTVFSLDATVVLLTPVALTAALAHGVSTRPVAQVCLRMANSASLLLPVSNLTNLLALPHLDLTVGGFALRMAPVLVVVLLVEYAGLRLLSRRDVHGRNGGLRTENTPVSPMEIPAQQQKQRQTLHVPVAVVALMLLGFVATSPFGVDPAWVAVLAALVLAGWGLATGVAGPRDVLAAAHPGFAVFVLGLGVVVAALAHGPLGDHVGGWLPDDGSGFVALLAIAAVATALAAVLTNLSATLLLLPLLAPLGTTAILAALLGLNIGSGLTWTGSLANLLWRRTLSRQGVRITSREFHRVSLTLTPVSLVAGVAVLSLLA
ncbi:SLC13 family permease [Nocardioides currus]|uniref:SLC13 family permease n=1 Tax=Nocardioides currus TaxID=2133958 RepID=UPI001401C85F|nr:SLC13 family permease [Nocardioides currus]